MEALISYEGAGEYQESNIYAGTPQTVLLPSILEDERLTEVDTVKKLANSTRPSFSEVDTPTDVPTAEEIITYITDSFKQIADWWEGFETTKGSGWIFRGVTELKLHMTRYNPLRGGSYIKTPEWIASKKSTINIENNNDECFKYALICAIDRPEKNPQRQTYYKKYNVNDLFDLDGFTYPVDNCAKTYKKFETQNPGYSLNVYKIKSDSKSSDDLETFYISDCLDPTYEKTIINLLLIHSTNEIGKCHYITITNFNGLLNDGSKNMMSFCSRCLHKFSGINPHQRLEEHLTYCHGINSGGSQRISLPSEDKNILEFSDHSKIVFAPYTIYYDTETTAVKINEDVGMKG
jgi:hypothetical protein